MREYLGCLVIAALAVLSCSSEKESQAITGRYLGTQTFVIGQAESSMYLLLRQQGSAIAGSVTPPFQMNPVAIQNGTAEGNTIRFDAKYGGITYHYEAVRQANQIQGNFEPIGCVFQSSGEPCLTDSNGGFNLTKQ